MNTIAKSSQAFFFHNRYYFSQTVKRVGIVGAGQMGTGIGIVASRVAGCEVKFIEPRKEGQ